MADQLTPQQRAAVDNRGGRLLVSAAAGSGKTKVLVDRLMKYLTDPVNPANIDSFLIITFTKAAAAELRAKIAEKLSELIAQFPDNRHLQRQLQRLYMTQISTVHAFCGALLRKYAYRLGVPADFRVCEENEAAELRINCMNATLDKAFEMLSSDQDFCAFLDSHGLGRSDENLAQILLDVYDRAMCHVDPAKWLDQCAFGVDTQSISDVSETPWGAYLLQRIVSDVQVYVPAFRRCAELAETMPSEGKAATLLRDSEQQLIRLCACESWDALYACKQIDFGRLTFTKNADIAVAEQIKAVRTTAIKAIRGALEQCNDISSRLLDDMKTSAAAIRGMTALVNAFTQNYSAEKQRRRIMDYSDLEQNALDLLMGKGRSGPTAIAKEIGEGYREVMVDEYQDANAVQDCIYMALTAQHRNCFMVGDVKQSIYQFRLADPGIFLEKYNTYVPAQIASEGEGRKIVLSSNFRSGGDVLQAANSVFEICMSPKVGGLHYGPEEALHEGIPHAPLGERAVELYCVQVQKDTYAEEAACVAARIVQLLNGTHMVRQKDGLRPIRPGDIAIILRSPKTNGPYFVRELAKYGIRCNGGSTNLMDAQEIQILRAILQVINNPRLDIPLAAALLSPAFGLTADDLATIRKTDRHSSLYDVLVQSELGAAGNASEIIKELRAKAPMMTVSGLLEEIFALTHIDTIYAAMPDGTQRSENIQIFCQLATGFDNQGAGSLLRFLDHLQLLEAKGVGAASDSSGDDCVTIISIHSSKGLEYPVVVLAGLSKSFNTEAHRAQVLCHKDLGIGMDAVDHEHRVRYPTLAKRAISMKMAEDELSEEMRILYVAMTRAKDRLILSYAASNLQQQLQQIVQMDNIGCHEHVIRQTGNIGRWVLLAAVRRTEAGELFSLAGSNHQASVQSEPWLIQVVEDVQQQEDGVFVDHKSSQMPGERIEQIRELLDYRYPHSAATAAPSKQTATQLKGRDKDFEAAENATLRIASERNWRTPKDMQYTAADRGSAMHAAMQYLSYKDCEDEDHIFQQLTELVQRGVMTQEQVQMVDAKSIGAFFQTDIGKSLRQHPDVVREFKFSILDDGALYDPALSGEQILLQGVVDCAMIDPDGITVIDFKTDRVNEKTVASVAQSYRSQVEAYARSLSRIYERPVKKKWLYFFHIARFVEV